MTKAKANGNYMNSMLALQEALTGGADEALLLDPEGYVAEGSGENMLSFVTGHLYPRVDELLGRYHAENYFCPCERARHTVVEKRITRDEVLIADEAFFTGTAAEVTPIRELDSRPIGSGSRGPITKCCSQTISMWFMDVTENLASGSHSLRVIDANPSGWPKLGRRHDYGAWADCIPKVKTSR